MRLSLVLFAICFWFSISSFAKPVDSDLVVPAEDSLIEQDRIQADKIKAEDVSSDAAQSRIVPKKDPNHTTVIPVYQNEDGATESAADLKSTKATPQKEKPQKFSGGVHVGPYNPTNLMGDVTGVTYQEIYGKGGVVLVQFEGEYQFWRRFGKLGVKGGLGFFTAQGPGRFANDPTTPALEIYTLYCLPFTAALTYSAHYWNRQLLVPYFEGGLDYFSIIEVRNDTVGLSEVHFGGSTAAHGAAGLKIQLDYFDKNGNWALDKEYGIKHMYLTAGVRDFVHVAGIYDFSALMFEGGFNFEF